MCTIIWWRLTGAWKKTIQWWTSERIRGGQSAAWKKEDMKMKWGKYSFKGIGTFMLAVNWTRGHWDFKMLMDWLDEIETIM